MHDNLDHQPKPPQLRDMLQSESLEFLMEAHNGVSAKIVEEAGFRGIWASGLSISASLGVRDSNEASWTQVLEILEFMSDATNIPILVDGDTGYGNFNNVRRIVQKLCQRKIAGICIEDKLFPKTNSFIGEGQPLAPVDEFCGKIKAGKDSQTNSSFCLIARVEALISGWGMEEALRRAASYFEAGADGILIHSKQSDGVEILEFLKQWDNRCPVIIVPTTYSSVPTEMFRNAKTAMIIWANHNIRASISAMQNVSRQIFREKSLIGVENSIVTVKDVFDLAGNAELADAEKIYLPKKETDIRVIILAASRGAKLGKLTENIPKCMIDIRGQPLLHRLTSTFNVAGLRNITVVRGYRKETINLPSINYVDNDEYETTGELTSLSFALDQMKGTTIVAYGDILFRHHILDQLLETEGDIVIIVDALWKEKMPDSEFRTRDLVVCSEPFEVTYHGNDSVKLVDIGHNLPAKDVHGEWIGLAKFSDIGLKALRDQVRIIADGGKLKSASMIDILSALKEQNTGIEIRYVTGQWLDVDNSSDLSDALKFL